MNHTSCQRHLDAGDFRKATEVGWGGVGGGVEGDLGWGVGRETRSGRLVVVVVAKNEK